MPAARAPYALGISDFRMLREGGFTYVDKTALVDDMLLEGAQVFLLAGLGATHDVRSNRESGFGRCDVLVLPKVAGEPGVALELERVVTERGETKDAALTAALRQIRTMDYTAELRARGASPIHEVAVVFEGKRAHVRVAGGDPPPGHEGANEGTAARRPRSPRRT